jgi:hypothetical protein
MTQTPNTPPAAGEKPGKEMTAAEAAKRVKREVTNRVKTGKKDGDGNDVYEDKTELVDVKASEVLDFKDYGTHVVVVTKDGKKFTDKKD